jgi:hypothetical protein
VTAPADGTGRGLRPVGLFAVSAVTFLLTVFGSRLLVNAGPAERTALAALGLVLAAVGALSAIAALRGLFANRRAQGGLAAVALLAAALIALNASGALMAMVTLLEQLARAA